MDLNEQILDRFLNGACTEDEEVLILEALQRHPDMLDEYLLEHPTFLENKYNKQLPEETSGRIFSHIYSAIDKKNKKPKKIAFAVGAAAVFILGVICFWKFDFSSHSSNLSHSLAIDSKVIKRNLSDSVQTWSLPDKSIVKAEPGAILSYAHSFNTVKRDVYLTGMAEFDIVHNGKKPFTVYSNKISTTVLGTRFSVEANRTHIEVKLFEGKVMVNNISSKQLKPVYLDPGNAVIYKIATGRFLTISNFNKKKGSPKYDKQPDIAAVKDPDADVIAFENTSMEYAIDRLADLYGVEIQYSPADVEHINLIAQVPKNQSLKKILNDIAITNGLNVAEAGKDVFVLEKKTAKKN